MKNVLARALLLTGVLVNAALAGNQVLLRTLDPADGSVKILVADHTGHLFVVSSLTTAAPLTRVVKLDLYGGRLAALDLPQLSFVTAAVADSQDNLILAGGSLVVKVDSQLQATIFSKSLPASMQAITVDMAGNIYLTGTTSAANFGTTSGAYQTRPPGGDVHGAAAA